MLRFRVCVFICFTPLAFGIPKCVFVIFFLLGVKLRRIRFSCTVYYLTF